MNRRNFLKFAAALLPCSMVAKLLGKKQIPAYVNAPYIPERMNPAYSIVPVWSGSDDDPVYYIDGNGVARWKAGLGTLVRELTI
jgi:hypothetical protein